MRLRLEKVRVLLPDFCLEANLELKKKVTALVGPSGAGKTTLLEVIAGIRMVESARIQLGDRVLTDTQSGLHIPPHHRRIGYVPQDLALFPHLSVGKNLLFGHRRDSRQPLTNPGEMAEILGIERLLDRPIGSLSGGERQRIALGRALLASPELLLLDEPLASLDDALRHRLLPCLARIRDRFDIPWIYVSHNRNEWAALCDEVLFLENGQITTKSPETPPAAIDPA